jgi:hypothetical protein
MTGKVGSWLLENRALLSVLFAQGLAILVYAVRLETRVNTLETRGSPHLERIDNRLTVLESLTRSNKESVDRIVDVLTRELGKPIPKTSP